MPDTEQLPGVGEAVALGDGRVGDHLVPVIDRQLTGHDGRAAIVPVVDDLQQVATLIVRQGGEPPVVEDQEFDACQALEQPAMTAVAACQRQSIKQPWHALIGHGAIVATGFVTERTGKPALADSGRADDDQVLMPIDPVAVGELLEQCLVEPAWRLHVDVLDDRRLAQTGELEPGGEPLVLAFDGLAVDHHRNALFEGERCDVW